MSDLPHHFALASMAQTVRDVSPWTPDMPRDVFPPLSVLKVPVFRLPPPVVAAS